MVILECSLVLENLVSLRAEGKKIFQDRNISVEFECKTRTQEVFQTLENRSTYSSSAIWLLYALIKLCDTPQKPHEITKFGMKLRFLFKCTTCFQRECTTCFQLVESTLCTWREIAISFPNFELTPLRVCRVKNSRTRFWTPPIALPGLGHDYSERWKYQYDEGRKKHRPKGGDFFLRVFHVNFGLFVRPKKLSH
jgi:hypothetical protein